MTLRVLSYNIRYGGRGREAQITAVLAAAAPDVVIFQEATDPAETHRGGEGEEGDAQAGGGAG